jgi:hypothetical protein
MRRYDAIWREIKPPERARSVSPIHLDMWNLEESEVLREWQNLDILFLNETNGPAFFAFSVRI